ncbi:hypothetical protein IAT38_008070 [Cryptococcus sp. DSM 104549]
MEAYLPSSSPLLTYSPCKACSPASGFATGEAFTGNDANGTDSGMVTYAGGTSVELNCTGTAITFDLTYGHPDSTALTPSISINGSTTLYRTSAKDLTLGQHNIQLSFTSNSTAVGPDQDDWVRVNAARCGLGVQAGDKTTNVTVDDTEWRDWKVLLTPGWNMLEHQASNWINTTQFEAELLTSSRDWNSSISWTEQVDSGNAVLFKGSAVWVYGISGGEAGSFEVTIDNATRGIFDASGGSRVYNQVLFHTSDLSDSNHNLTLRNVEQGKRLSFDRLVAVSNLYASFVSRSQSGLPEGIDSPRSVTTPIPASVPSTSTWSSPSSSASTSSTAAASTNSGAAIGRGAIIGISVSCVVLVLALIAWAWVAWFRRQKKQRKEGETGLSEKPAQTTFWRLYQPKDPDSARSFIPLPSPTTKEPPPPFFHFPTPSLSLPRSPAKSDQNQKSFLKISARKKPALGKEPSFGEVKGFTISKPTPVAVQGMDFEPAPSFASGSDHDPEMYYATGHDPAPGHSPEASPLPQADGAGHAAQGHPFAGEKTGGEQEGERTLRRETLSPLAAALSGQTASPLTVLGTGASSTSGSRPATAVRTPAGSGGDSYFPKMTPLGGNGGLGLGGLGGLAGFSAFGRRKGSVSNSLDTRREVEEEDVPDTPGPGILSAFSAGSAYSPHDELQQSSAGARDDKGLSGVTGMGEAGEEDPQGRTGWWSGVSGFGTTSQAGEVGMAYGGEAGEKEMPWGAQGNGKGKGKEVVGGGMGEIPLEDEPMPTRRFFGKAFGGDRPTSGSSARTGNSVGSAWRYM